VGGFVLVIGGIVLLLVLAPITKSIWSFVPSLFLIGFGTGLMLTPSVNIVQSSFPESQQGEISGLSRSVSNLGSSFGTAIAGTILISVVAQGNRSYVLALASVAIIGLIGLVAALMMPSDAGKVAPAE
jgi:MFS family permease